VSNALGANSLAILFSLGVPWFLRTMLNGAWTADSKIKVFSNGTEYTIIALIFAVATLYISVAIAGYQLRRELGFVLIFAYLMFASFGILVESGVILKDIEGC
jgi:solute carrier family 24 (sodium/potassium/calcium exchanger), member 4